MNQYHILEPTATSVSSFFADKRFNATLSE